MILDRVLMTCSHLEKTSKQHFPLIFNHDVFSNRIFLGLYLKEVRYSISCVAENRKTTT